MPTLEERVAFLEGQVSEQSHALLELRDAVRHLEARLEARLSAFEQRIEMRMESRYDGLNRRMDTLEDKLSRQFVWMVGVQVTTFVAIVGALLARA